MKIDTRGNNCFQIFIRQCMLWFCCKQRDNDNTNTTSKVTQREKKNIHDKERMFEDLCKVNNGFWRTEDIHEAVSSSPDYRSALQYLSHECQICCDKYPYSKFVTMTHCSCSLCEECFIHHFSSVIKEKSILHMVCPICMKPDLENEENSEASMEFFNLLDTQIHHYLDQATHELFQRKLRDRALMAMPNFRWCSHCPFGILHESDTLQMECPACEKSTCFNCKEQWDDNHEILSCEEFKLYKLQHQDDEVDAYLAMHGIECPFCAFRFDLWKGGCLHFKCTQCQHAFCGGCRQPFHQGSDCGFSDKCEGKGLHAHHTRNCFYYLRDWNLDRLQQLLQQNGILCKSDLTKEPPRSLKGILTLRKTLYQSNDDETENKEDNSGGEMDYKESLVKLINANSLDPADLYTEDEMRVELQRWNVTVPENGGDESGETFLQEMKMKIKQEIPLPVNADMKNAFIETT